MNNEESCVNCIHLNGLDERPCIYCSINKTNRFEKKKDDLDKIFVGAPIMLCGNNSKNCTNINYLSPCIANNYHYRLPTLDESPRNVWLCPPLIIPNKLKKHNVLYRYSKEDVEHTLIGSILSFDWDEVEAFMILKDFKNEI